MRKVFLSVLFLIVLLGLIRTAFNRDKPHHPTSIANGLTFTIPNADRERFYLTGLQPNPLQRYNLTHFINNKVSNAAIDSTQVLYDDDLIADSGIEYVSEVLPENPKNITLTVKGDLDPKVVRGFLKKNALIQNLPY
jgi:hypothetical protein